MKIPALTRQEQGDSKASRSVRPVHNDMIWCGSRRCNVQAYLM